MFRFFPIIFVLEIFCLYHAYRNRADHKWFWFIIIFPLLGCILYLYHHFYSRENLKVVTEGVKGVVNKNYELEKLEKEVKFSDSIRNKTNLAEKYAEMGRTQEAIQLYQSCLEGYNADNTVVKMRLLECLASTGEYQKAVEVGDSIKGDKLFSKSWSRIGYAWSLYHCQRIEDAEENFKATESRYSNYPHRLEYAKFLHEIGRITDCTALLEELLSEFDNMDSSERRQNSADRKEIKDFYASIQNVK